jgi:hypothetical protein
MEQFQLTLAISAYIYFYFGQPDSLVLLLNPTHTRAAPNHTRAGPNHTRAGRPLSWLKIKIIYQVFALVFLEKYHLYK